MAKGRVRACQQKKVKKTSASVNGINKGRRSTGSASSSNSKPAKRGASKKQNEPVRVGDKRKGKGRRRRPRNLPSCIVECSVVLIRLTDQEIQDLRQGKTKIKKVKKEDKEVKKEVILDDQNIDIDYDVKSETEDILIGCDCFVPSKEDVKTFLQETKKMDLVGVGLALAAINVEPASERETYTKKMINFPMKHSLSRYHDVPEKILTHAVMKKDGTDLKATQQLLLVKWKDDFVPNWIEADFMHKYHPELVAKWVNLPALLSCAEFESFFNDPLMEDIDIQGVAVVNLVMNPSPIPPDPDAADPIPNPTTDEEDEIEIIILD